MLRSEYKRINSWNTRYIAALLFLGLFLTSGCERNAATLKPAEILADAKAEMRIFNFDAAKKLLNRSESLFSEEDKAYPEFLYLQSLANWHVVPPVPEGVAKAREGFTKFIQDFPDHELTPSALIMLGRIHDLRDFPDDQPDPETARSHYTRLLERHPSHPLAGEAVLRIAMTHIKETQSPDGMTTGITILTDWLDANPGSEYASLFQLFIGNLYDQYLNEPVLAYEYYLKAYRSGFVNPGRAGTNLWRLAELALQAGIISGGHPVPGGNRLEWDLSLVGSPHLDVAIEACQTLIRDYARSGRAYEASLLLQAIQDAHPQRSISIPVLQLFDLEIEVPNS